MVWEWGRNICFVAHIELQPGVEVVVGHNVHLAHLGVHIALNSHQPRKKSQPGPKPGSRSPKPDDGWVPTGLGGGLRVVFEVLAHRVHHL